MTVLVNIRPAAPRDVAAIADLYAREVEQGSATFETTPPDLDEMSRRMAAVAGQGLPWLTAEIDGLFAGYAYLSPFRPRPAYRYCAELSVYVAENAQRRGVGSALMDALVAAARAKGLRHLIGAVGDSANLGSIALHRRAGFREVGAYRQVGWKFDRWIDVVLMQLDLDPEGGPPAGDGLSL